MRTDTPKVRVTFRTFENASKDYLKYLECLIN